VPEDQMPGAVAAREAAANPRPKPAGPKPPYTARQGQYLAFIHNHTRRHNYPPSELDIQMFFGVSAPSVHLMIVTLTGRGFIERMLYTPRSVRILLAPELLPQLENVRHPNARPACAKTATQSLSRALSRRTLARNTLARRTLSRRDGDLILFTNVC